MTMEQNTEFIISFESAMKRYNSRKPVAVYNENAGGFSSRIYTSQDVLSNISKQLNAMQRADGIRKDISSRGRLMSYKKLALEPINSLPLGKNVNKPLKTCQNINKFETHFVSDTQLINIVEKAEKLVEPKDITHEFENSFCDRHIEMKNDLNHKSYSHPNENNDISEDLNTSPILNKKLSSINTVRSREREILTNIDNAKNLNIKINNDCSNNNNVTSSAIPLINDVSPLIYKLDAFETFEELAFPVVEKNTDLVVAKQIINSQIIEKELYLGIHAKPTLTMTNRSLSPILNTKNNIRLAVHSKASDSMKINNIPLKEPDKVSLDMNVTLPPETKNIKCFEDDIFLSSDEENSKEEENFYQIPFTCALETSFYNQCDILDKTMYVGFQTASNKSIQIKTESFSRAHVILEDLDSCSFQPSLAELVAICDNTSKVIDQANILGEKDKEETITETELSKERNDSIIPSKKCEMVNEDKPGGEFCVISSLINNNSLNSEVNIDFKQMCSVQPEKYATDRLEFQTASFNSIKLSEKALAKSLQVFKDIDLYEKYDSKEPANILRGSLCNPTQQYCNSESKIEQSGTMSPNGKKKTDLFREKEQISLDDQTILQEFENDLILQHVNESVDNWNKIVTPNNYQELQEKDKPIYKYIDKRKQEETPNNISMNRNFIGFKTANNKQINVSEHALARTKNIFEEFNLSNDFDKINNNGGIFPDNTSKFENTVFKEDTLRSVINQNQEENESITSNILLKNSNVRLSPLSNGLKIHELEMFESCTFKTASNKPVVISSKALTGSIKFLNKIDVCRADVMDQCCDFENTKELNQKIKTVNNMPNSDSNSARAKMENVLESNVCEAFGSNDIVINGLRSNSHSITDLPVTYESNAIKCNNLSNANNFDQCLGFKTASNKQLKISDEALAKSKKLFEDLQLTESNVQNSIFNNKHQENKTNIKKFQTTTNEHYKQDQISEKQNIQKIGDHVFKGFQTASNKRVKISEESLAASKKIFQDLVLTDDDQNIPIYDCVSDKNRPSTSANTNKYDFANNKVESNVQSKTAKSIEQEITNNQLQLTSFNGFHTASNKKVKVSDQALAKSKKLFLDLDLTPQTTTNHNQAKKDEDISIARIYNYPVASCEGSGLEGKLANTIRTTFDVNRKNYPNFSEDLKEFQKSDNLPTHKTVDSIGKVSEKVTIEMPFDYSDRSPMALTLKQNKKASNVPCSIVANCEENIVNTQLLNNFEETLYTEDFYKDVKSKESKRSGSPILICPHAKKRKKFEAPYKSDQIPKIEKLPEHTFEVNTSLTFTFDEKYKRNKKISLKTLRNIEELHNGHDKVDPYLLAFNYDNLLDFLFTNKRNELSDDTWNTKDIKNYFLTLVNKKIIPHGWLDNHLKLIIYKLISYEIEFNYTMDGVCSVKNVLEQLKYRFDRELYDVVRPTFRRLLEKDDVSTKTMILRVIAIYVDGVVVTRVTETRNIELLLTDGWYCIKACLDQMLTRLVREQKIKVGTKLATHGAELLNCEQGIAPWEDTSSVRLKLFGNSTRRARWDARLGYHGAAAILSNLSSVQLEGGRVSKLRAYVTRVYPTLYVEKFDDGSTVTRSERLEHLYQMKYESDRQAVLEKIYEEVEKEFSDQESQDSECDSEVRNFLDSGSQIGRLMKQSRDPGEFRTNLTNTQCVMLQDYTTKRREKLLQAMQTRVQDKLKAKGLHLCRNVVPVMKVRIADVTCKGEVSKAMMSVWRPNDAVLDIIKEGTWIDVFNIVPTAMRYSEIQLSAGRQTVFNPSRFKRKENKIDHIVSSLNRTCYKTKDIVQNPMTITNYSEVDVVGMIFSVEPTNDQFQSIKGQLFQNVYLTDAEKNIICINFWGGLKKFGYENVLDTGQVVACMNLQKRTGNTRRGIPQFRATELSYFTKISKLAHVKKTMDDFHKELSSGDVQKLCKSCIDMKNNYSIFKNDRENVSPYRINHNDYSISKHRAFIDSPLIRKNHADDILNLSGLDFESTFKQIDTQNMSASMLSRKKRVNEKIAKLKMYGEPPPLSNIHIINKSKNATIDYRSPVTSRNDSSNYAARGKLKEKSRCAIDYVKSSPVISEDNYKQRMSVNPVKLNFSKEVSDENKVDPFAEDFDVSPPLSLD